MNVLNHVTAALLAAACLVAGCSGTHGDRGAATKEAAQPAQPTVPSEAMTAPRPATTLVDSGPATVEAVADRTAGFVVREVKAHYEAMARGGLLTPARLAVDLQPAPADEGSPRKALIACLTQAIACAWSLAI